MCYVIFLYIHEKYSYVGPYQPTETGGGDPQESCDPQFEKPCHHLLVMWLILEVSDRGKTFI
jgi:hypothetical protein